VSKTKRLEKNEIILVKLVVSRSSPFWSKFVCFDSENVRTKNATKYSTFKRVFRFKTHKYL